MQLNENLQNCLLAVISRYPVHSVNINETVLGPQMLGAEAWYIPDLIQQIKDTYPTLLQDRARLVIDEQRCELYLVNQSEETPALWIYCRGKIPTCRKHALSRMQK
jgi:hypothetical protein